MSSMSSRVAALHRAYTDIRSLANIRRVEGYRWRDIAYEAGVSRRTLRRYLRRARRIGR